MSIRHREEPRTSGPTADRATLTLSGALLLMGFVVNAIQRGLLHPTGAEDDHEAIFAEYAASDAWAATHLAEFVLVLVALAGLLSLAIGLSVAYEGLDSAFQDAVAIGFQIVLVVFIIGLLVVSRRGQPGAAGREAEDPRSAVSGEEGV
jgi:hypothetical protein